MPLVDFWPMEFYLVGDEPGQVWAKVTPTSVQWNLLDRQNSVVGRAGNDGTETVAYAYNSFGKPVEQGWEENSIGYLGQRRISYDFTHLNGRWYDQTSGRWITQQPFQLAAGDSNAYRFAGNRPLQLTGSVRDVYAFAGQAGDPASAPSIAPQSDIDTTLAPGLMRQPYERTRVFDHPTGWMSYVPVVGSLMSSLAHFEDGNWGRGALYLGLALTDVFLVKSLVTAGGRFVLNNVLAQGTRQAAAANLARAAGRVAAVQSGRAAAGAAHGAFEVGMGVVSRDDAAAHILRRAVYGAIDPTWGTYGSLAGSVIGAGIGSLVGDRRSIEVGMAIGDFAGGIGGAGAWGYRNAIVESAASWRGNPALRMMGYELAAGGLGGSAGYALGGWDGAIMGMNAGRVAGHAALVASPSLQRALLLACFAGDTPLLTPEGSKRIDQFRVGDLVLSRDEYNPDGPVVPKVVEEVFVRTGRILHLHVGGRIIKTTPEHPFYVRDRGWTAAAELTVGDLLSSHDGQWAAVEDVLDTGEYEDVYNLRVATYHTYFVGAEEWCFSAWAHNNYGPLKSLPGADSAQGQEGKWLATRAKDLLIKVGLTKAEKDATTIAVGKVMQNGRVVEQVVINGTAPASVVAKIRRVAPAAIQAEGGMHAETYLYLLNGGRANVSAIGVSHWKGPCPELCRPFFTDRSFDSIWWFGFVK
jgi:RHS repeat-associated protein